MNRHGRGEGGGVTNGDVNIIHTYKDGSPFLTSVRQYVFRGGRGSGETQQSQPRGKKKKTFEFG